MTGTSGNIAKFGASNSIVNGTIAESNIVTAGSNYTSGDLVQAAGANKTTSSSGIQTGNVVTAASSASSAKQICGATGATKACNFQSLSDLSSTTYAGVATGAVNVLAACPANAATAVVAGTRSQFYPNLANTTTTPTYNLCTQGAATITKQGTAALAVNDLVTGQIADVIFDGTNWELQNPNTTGGGGGGAPVLSSVTAALATNTIANGDFAQTMAMGTNYQWFCRWHSSGFSVRNPGSYKWYGNKQSCQSSY